MTTEILKKFAYFFMKIGSTFDGSVFGHPVSIQAFIKQGSLIMDNFLGKELAPLKHFHQ